MVLMRNILSSLFDFFKRIFKRNKMPYTSNQPEIINITDKFRKKFAPYLNSYHTLDFVSGFNNGTIKQVVFKLELNTGFTPPEELIMILELDNLYQLKFSLGNINVGNSVLLISLLQDIQSFFKLNKIDVVTDFKSLP